MSPVAIQLLRRLALMAVALSAVLVLIPRVVVELSDAAPDVEAAVRSVEAARGYGATRDQPAFAGALRDLERAQDALRRGQRHEARAAAHAARDQAVESQRLALVVRQEERRRAVKIANSIDALLNELEDLYRRATTGMDKKSISELLSQMKQARAAGAGVLVAYEDGDYPKVLAGEKPALVALSTMRDQLRALASVQRSRAAK